MATREPGVFRRSKGGETKRVGKPTQPQKYGAHSQHPTKVEPAATSPDKRAGKPKSDGGVTTAETSTAKESGGNADT